MKKQSTSFLSFLLNEMEDPTAVVGMEQEPQDGNPPDAITLNIPLLVRLLEYAKEDAEDDMALHRVAEQLTKLAADGKTLTMDDYMISSAIQKTAKTMPKPSLCLVVKLTKWRHTIKKTKKNQCFAKLPIKWWLLPN